MSIAFKRIGVFCSKKTDEKRIPIHPEHLPLISTDIRNHLYFEKNYGVNFELGDEYFKTHAAGTLERHSLLQQSDLVIILKPTEQDLLALSEGTVVCGWVHCLQQPHIVQAAIDRKLTLIAFENMHYWSGPHTYVHVFHKNNEIAGEMGVSEALRLCGYDPHYGNPMSATVIGFGSVGKGAVYGLKQIGINEITVYSRRDIERIADRLPGVDYQHITKDKNGTAKIVYSDKEALLFQQLKHFDVIVNAIKQNDVENPWMFVNNSQLSELKRNSIIIDISCDKGMGFEFAEPTTFADPIKRIEPIYYYSVDHIPSCVWKTASFEISKSLLPFIPVLLEGHSSWEHNRTVRHALEVQDGLILNTKILSFQKRASAYPYHYD